MEPAWRLAHDRDIVPEIGQACYDEICARLQADPEQTTAADQALMKALENFGVWAIWQRWLETNPSTGLAPVGYVEEIGSGYSQSSAQERQIDIKTAKSNKEFYLVKQFRPWLEANQASYPCLPTQDPCRKQNLYGGWITSTETTTDERKREYR